jgi:hypothetical protein
LTFRSQLALPFLIACALLAGCGLDEDDGGSQEQAASTERTTPPRAGAGGARTGILDFETVERLTPDYLSKHPGCPPGEFKPTRNVLTTLPKGATGKTREPPRSYNCGGRVDQVVYARFEDPAHARRLLDPKNTANSTSFVAGDVVVLVNFGIDKKVDIAGFFAEIKRACDCGRTRYKRSRRRGR